MEKALNVFFGQEVKVVFGSRVDAKVNALSMTGHFDLNLFLFSKKSLKSQRILSLLLEKSENTFLKICLHLNGILKNLLKTDDLSVISLQETSLSFHATKDATSREYEYRVSLSKINLPVWNSRVSYFSTVKSLNLDLLNFLSKKLMKTGDFKNLSVGENSSKNTICKINKAFWRFEPEHKLYFFEIEANRFLYKMVRLIVGVQLAVQNSRISQNSFLKALEQDLSKEKKDLIKRYIAPPEGLFLKKINYLAY